MGERVNFEDCKFATVLDLWNIRTVIDWGSKLPKIAECEGSTVGVLDDATSAEV